MPNQSASVMASAMSLVLQSSRKILRSQKPASGWRCSRSNLSVGKRNAILLTQRDLRFRFLHGLGALAFSLDHGQFHRLEEQAAEGADIEIANDIAAGDERDQPGFLGNDDDYGVGIFGDADGGAVAGAEVLAQPRVLRQRQKARGSGDAFALDDDRAVVQRRLRIKDGDEQ